MKYFQILTPFLLQLNKNFSNKEKNKFFSSFRHINDNKYDYFIFKPALYGSRIGTFIGGYAAYKETKNDKIMNNIAMTHLGAVFGYCMGFISGVFWPVTASVLIARSFEKSFF